MIVFFFSFGIWIFWKNDFLVKVTENRPPFRTEQAAGSLAVFSEFILIKFSYLPTKVQDNAIRDLVTHSVSQSETFDFLVFTALLSNLWDV